MPNELRFVEAELATMTTAPKKPNILVLWGDDVGMWNISAPRRRAPRGRAAFINGQYPIRVGLATVGLPGSDIGLSAEDPTLAEMLKPLGYATAQFGKNHLGDRDEHLPTAHGFDEFFGILRGLPAPGREPRLQYRRDDARPQPGPKSHPGAK